MLPTLLDGVESIIFLRRMSSVRLCVCVRVSVRTFARYTCPLIHPHTNFYR